MQFDAQHRYYQDQFANATLKLVLLDDLPIGRLYIDRREDEIRIIDIVLLPQHRNAGIGTALMRDILVEAQEARKPVRIQVEGSSRAVTLYSRLGFVQVGGSGVHLLMEWSPRAQDEAGQHAG